MDEKKIRKLYGEKMWHFCRDNFSTILDEPGKLISIMESYFNSSHLLFDDLYNQDKLVMFKNYIYSIYREEKRIIKNVSIDTPEVLFDKAGYYFYECSTEEEIQKFKKYYRDDEELCTFYGNRLNSCYVFFAVKKNADSIDRNNFLNPNRQDEYGTSVISIQFTKDKSHTLSIKNRYNHKVVNPDATFSNNLDNIISGLTKSFEIHYGLKQEFLNGFDLNGYVRGNDGKYYKYNYEICNNYYCTDNIILNNFKIEEEYLDMARYLVFDYFILDMQEKKFIKHNYILDDCFFEIEKNIEKIEILNDNENKNKKINLYHSEGISSIILDKYNRIIKYSNPFIEEIGDHFLSRCYSLKIIDLPKVKVVGRNFLSQCVSLKEISLPNVKKVGSDFGNSKIEKVNLPNLEVIDEYFLLSNSVIKELSLPSVRVIGNKFLTESINLEHISLPNVRIINSFFLTYNKKLKELILPNIRSIGNYCLSCNKSIDKFEAPLLEKIGLDFLADTPYMCNKQLNENNITK